MLFVACAAQDPGPRLRSDTASLERTAFAAGLAAPLDPRANLLWCASLPMAWLGMEELVGVPIEVLEPSSTIELLNAESWDPSDLDEDAYLARAGFVRDGVVEAIQEDLQRSGAPRDAALDRRVADEPLLAAVSYARLEKSLGFEVAFEDLEDWPLSFRSGDGADERQVDAFGLGSYDPDKKRHRRLSEQVRIHERGGEFVVHLVPRGARDRILLCRVEAGPTLGATWEAARALVESTSPARLLPMDQLAVPELDFELTHVFSELTGLGLANPGCEGVFLADVRQDLRLRLDEQGMLVRSVAWVALGAMATPDPRRLVFDRPFLLAAIETDARQPYLLAWIGHPEILSTRPATAR